MKMNTLTKDWLWAIFTVLILFSASNLMVGISGRNFHANPVVATCAVTMSSALVLLLIGGHGRLARETMRSVDTWIYGFILILGNILYFALFAYVSSTEGTLLQRATILVTMMGGWFFLARRPSRYQLLGALMVFGGLLAICTTLEGPYKSVIIALVILSSAAQAIRIFVSELHRPHSYAASLNDVKSKCRVVGFVMFTVGLIFIPIALLFSWASTSATLIQGWPQPQDFLNPTSLISGLLIGVFLTAPIRYFEFTSAERIKAENFAALSALTPVSTFAFEWLASPLIGSTPASWNTSTLISGMIITLGGFIIACSPFLKKKSPEEFWKEHLSYQPQNIHAVEETHEILTNTLTHFKGDEKQAAAALQLPESVLTILLADNKKEMAFKPDAIKRINRIYKQNVLQCDPLTGLPNRNIFLKACQKAIATGKPFTVFYLDLNKFKPVNDTYGHEAGDAILIGIAKRLQELALKGSTVTRMGGDEYCLLVPLPKAEALPFIRTIKTAINKPFTITSIEEPIAVSASIGSASFPENGTDPEALIEAADGGMFGVKHAKEEHA